MAKDNEEVKATLLEGNTRFSSAAAVMGNVKTELETLLANLNWLGPSDKSAKDAYMQAHTQFSTDAGTAQDILQKCAGALKSLHDAIVQAEEKAKQAKEQQDTEEVVILGVLTFAQAVEMIVTPLLIAADEAAAATLETVETEVMQLPDVLQDMEAVNALPAVDDVTTLPVNDIPSPDAPTGEAPNTPTGEAPNTPEVKPPKTPEGQPPETPEGELPKTPEGQPPKTPEGQPHNTPPEPLEEKPVAGKDTPEVGGGKHDSGIGFDKKIDPEKFGNPPQKYGDIPLDELPNQMPPQEVQANPMWGKIKPNGEFEVTEYNESTGVTTITIYDKSQNMIFKQEWWEYHGKDILRTTYPNGDQSVIVMKNGKDIETYSTSIHPQTGIDV